MPKDPYTVDIRGHSDDRGTFLPVTDGFDLPLARVYICENYAQGTIRGFHYHERETKGFFVIRGAVKFVAVNPDKPEETHVFALSPTVPKVLVIPPGWAHGWMALKEDTLLLGMSDATLQQSLADDRRFAPQTWGNLWEVVGR